MAFPIGNGSDVLNARLFAGSLAGRTSLLEATRGGDMEGSRERLTTADIAGTQEETQVEGGRSAEAEAEREPLLPGDQSERMQRAWDEIQRDFVDRPRESVEQADLLVADLMQRLAATFSAERGRLESQWDGGDEVSTEDLRVALTRYRSFFERLLST
jgi:hypothetical protein